MVNLGMDAEKEWLAEKATSFAEALVAGLRVFRCDAEDSAAIEKERLKVLDKLRSVPFQCLPIEQHPDVDRKVIGVVRELSCQGTCANNSELQSLCLALEEIIERSPSFGLKVLDLFFTRGDHRLKDGLIEFTYFSAVRTGGDPIMQLHVTDRFRELATTAIADELKRLGINE